jgi:hypothetical protein
MQFNFIIISEVQFVSQCNVDEEFTDSNYKPAPDGLFTIRIINPDQIDLARVQKMRIEFAGSSIPRGGNNMTMIE